MAARVVRSDDEWRAQLTEQQFNVLRLGHTDPRGVETEITNMLPASGYFACRGCDAPLYAATAKFRCTCGWPAFSRCYAHAMRLAEPLSRGTSRSEIKCAACHGHLGHVFNKDRHSKETGQRHCVNASALRYVDADAPEGTGASGVLPTGGL